MAYIVDINASLICQWNVQQTTNLRRRTSH